MTQQDAGWMVLVYAGVFLIMGLSGVVVPILDILGGIPFWSSVLFSAYFGGALVSLIPFGVLTDRYGAQRTLATSLVLTTLSGIALSLFSDVAVLSVARFVEGVGCGAFFPPSLSMLSHPSKAKRRTGIFNLLLNAGLACGVILGGVLALLTPKGGIYLFTLPLLLLTPYVLSSLIRGGASSHSAQDVGGVVRASIGMFFSRQLVPLWVVCITTFGCTGAVIAMYPFYTMELLSKDAQGFVLGGVYVGGILASLMAAYIPTSPAHMLRGGVLITALGTFLTIYTPLGPTVFGLGSGFVFVGAVVYASQMARRTAAPDGLLMGTLTTMVYLGFATLPPIFGMLHPILSLPRLIGLNALIVLSTAVLSPWADFGQVHGRGA